ncbi:TetR/AcrR family transcriptional regulator [Micromonospora tulbaghiae]|uniref:TetR/AcrR family transcriptional regulator n=1 Tax=Micromonospora tulbaghiae TaxID=479978 RepID=UPI0033E18973
MTPARPYHHGNLRQAVLDEAVAVVRERGAAELSLREVAAAIGVTHAAPRRHFPGRQELLDALAVEGFTRLGVRLREAVDASPGYPARIHAVATAYLDFATAEANLVELMFAHKHGADGEAVGRSAEAAFAPLLQVFRQGEAEGLLAGRSPDRLALILLATLQGLAGLVNCGVAPADQVGVLVDEAVARFPHAAGSSAAR